MSSRHDIKLTINDYLWTDTATDTKIPPRNFRIGRAEQSRAQEEYLRIFYSARNLIARIVYVDIRNVFFFLTRCTNVQRLARVETVPLFAISGTVVRKFDKLSPAERGRTQYTRHVLHTLSTDRTTYLNKNFHRID